jgi:hypothetical protein
MRKTLFLIFLFFGILFAFGSIQTNSIAYYFEQINSKLISGQTPINTSPPIQSFSEGSVLLPENYISSDCINYVLEKANSPAKGTGEKWVEMAKKYNINPAIGLAFFRQESSLGTKGVAVENKSVGNIKDPTTGTFKKYSSWSESIEDWYSLISGRKYIGAGKTTIREIYLIYAPPSDNPNWELLVSNIENFAKEYNAYTGRVC